MKNVILGTLLILGISFSGIGQELDTYQYVRVPDKFEFQKSENEYQLNALTAFLFEKYGFESLYKVGVPAGIDPCSILDADVVNDSGLFTTKLYVTLTNCRRERVFTSQTGKSKEKEYEKAFHEALREAFSSVETLDHQFEATPPEVIIDPVVTAKERDEVVPDSIEVIVDPVVSAEERKELEKEMQESEFQKGASEEVLLVNGSESYRLIETPSGFELFNKASQEKFAQLIRSNGGDFYHYSSEKVNGIALFDGNGSLVVEYIEPGGQLVTLIFRKQN